MRPLDQDSTKCEEVGEEYHAGTPLQYQVPAALQLLPAAIWITGTFSRPESRRFLLSVNRRAEAMQDLCRIRHLDADHPYVAQEYQGIERQIDEELEIVSGSTTWDLFKETFTVRTNRRRFILRFLCRLFGQWSGANAITQYFPTILPHLGIASEETRFLTTGVFAIVKFVSTMLVAIFIINFIGGPRSLMTGITMQILTLAFIGAYLGVTNGMSAGEIESSPSAKAASYASIVAIFIHAVAWSIGWFSIPYLVSSEVFPIRIRSLNISILRVLHWAFYFGGSRAMPSLLVATDRYGAFVLLASICTASLVSVFFAMPETSSRSPESMGSLFQRAVVHGLEGGVPDLRRHEAGVRAYGREDEGRGLGG